MAAGIEDYSAAIVIRQMVQAPQLRGGHPVQKNGHLVRYAGGFCVVYPFEVGKHKYAVRCWHTPVDSVQGSLDTILSAVARSRLKYFVPCSYVKDAILTANGPQPALVMDWVEAPTLKRYIGAHLDDRQALDRLAESFLVMVKDLHNAGISHGDLQHGNILVQPGGGLTLVDYDSMYVPGMHEVQDEIKGLAGEKFFHADYEATLIGTYGTEFEETLVIEGGVVPTKADDAAAAGNDAAPAENDAAPEAKGTITVAASPTPHAEILAKAKDILAAEGWELKVTEFEDYVQPNLVVESGEIDANYFQHVPYLDDFNKENGTSLVSAAGIHYEPFGIYPGTKAALADLADGDTVAVPNDTTNEARALLLLQANGLITLKDGVGLTATTLDIVDNPKNLKIQELEAAQVSRVRDEVALVVLNGNYALEAGLSVGKDAIAFEAADSEAAKTYVNIIAVKAGQENSEKTQALVKALESEEIRQFITDTYDGAVIPFK